MWERCLYKRENIYLWGGCLSMGRVSIWGRCLYKRKSVYLWIWCLYMGKGVSMLSFRSTVFTMFPSTKRINNKLSSPISLSCCSNCPGAAVISSCSLQQLPQQGCNSSSPLRDTPFPQKGPLGSHPLHSTAASTSLLQHYPQSCASVLSPSSICNLLPPSWLLPAHSSPFTHILCS